MMTSWSEKKPTEAGVYVCREIGGSNRVLHFADVSVAQNLIEGTEVLFVELFVGGSDSFCCKLKDVADREWLRIPE